MKRLNHLVPEFTRFLRSLTAGGAGRWTEFKLVLERLKENVSYSVPLGGAERR